MPLSHDEILRYSRHLVMPEVTLAGQQRLKDARVLCVGAGGLGSPLALYLAAAGVGTIGLVEFDTVDLTNIQRQVLYATADVGRPKLEAARERLAALNPEIEIVPHALRLTSDNVMELFAGLRHRRRRHRQLPDPLPRQRRLRAGRQAQRLCEHLPVRRPGQRVRRARGPCYRCLFPEPPPPGLVPSCAEGGVLGVLPGIVGSLQALEVIKLMLGIGEPLIGRLVLFDALGFTFREVALAQGPGLRRLRRDAHHPRADRLRAFCGIRGEEAARRTGPAAGRSPSRSLDARREAGERIELLDVREPHEFDDRAHIPARGCSR